MGWNNGSNFLFTKGIQVTSLKKQPFESIPIFGDFLTELVMVCKSGSLQVN